MKSIIQKVSLLFFFLSLSAQVEIQIANGSSEDYLILKNIGLGQEAETINAVNGKIQLDEITAGSYSFVTNGVTNPIYLENDGDIAVNVIEGHVSFEGELALENEFWYHFVEVVDSVYSKDVIRGEWDKTVDEFEMWLFSNRLSQLKMLHKHPKKGQFSSSFIDFVKVHIFNRYHTYLLGYQVENAKRSSKANIVPLPRIMLEELNTENVFSDGYLNDPMQYELADYYVYYLSSEINDFIKFPSKTASLEAKFLSVHNLIDQRFAQYAISKYIIENKDEISPSVIRRYHKLFSFHETTGFAAIIEKECKAEMEDFDESNEAKIAQKEKIKKNKESQPFQLKDEKGESFYISDLKGKVVYVDFWASWCGPCRKQFPFAKELKTKLTKKEKEKIVFLYISIDSDEATWKGALQKLGIEGINVLSPGGWGSSVTQHFNISSIPRYMIIDKNGNFHNPNAPRPSDPTILDLLRQLL